MTWNHRVIRRTHPQWKRPYFAVHEVFYDEDDVPYLVTQEPVDVGGESLDEVRQSLEMMAAALEKPVIDMSYFDELYREQAVLDFSG